MKKGPHYPRIIKTDGPEIDTTHRWHEEKLANFLVFNYPATNDKMPVQNKVPYTGKRHIEFSNTSTCVKHQTLIITTVFICCDEIEEANEYKA